MTETIIHETSLKLNVFNKKTVLFIFFYKMFYGVGVGCGFGFGGLFVDWFEKGGVGGNHFFFFFVNKKTVYPQKKKTPMALFLNITLLLP